VDGEAPVDGETPPDDGEAPVDDETLDEETVEFTVEVGSTASTVANDLEGTGLVESSDAFLDELKSQGAETKLKAGTFEIAPGTSIADIVKKLTKG
jgi:cell division protein YceG involved in septum cleavage